MPYYDPSKNEPQGLFFKAPFWAAYICMEGNLGY